MKNVGEIVNRKLPLVAIDKKMEKYRNEIRFPDKLEKANKTLKTAKLPKRK